MPFLAKNTELGKLEILEVYEYYDIPRFFLCSNQYGYYYLSLSVSDSDDGHGWLYAHVSKARLKKIRTGKINLYSAFKETEDGCVFKITTLGENSDTVETLLCNDVPDELLPLKGTELEIPQSQHIPIGKNHVVVTPSLPGMQNFIKTNDDIVIRAFSEVRNELSSDRLIADPKLDNLFIKRCHEYGSRFKPVELNLRLMALRKASKLSDLPKSRRDGLEPGIEEKISFACELALRLIRMKKGVTLDQMLCDQDLVKEFDDLAKKLSPGYSSLAYRLSALNVRKRGTFEWIAERVNLKSTENVKKLNINKIPEAAGLYLFSSNDRPLFINQTSNLRDRLTLHLQNSDNMGLPTWLWEKPLQHSYVTLSEKDTIKFRRNLEQSEMRVRETFLNFYVKEKTA